jgi:hypothetical protein
MLISKILFNCEGYAILTSENFSEKIGRAYSEEELKP